MTHLKKTLAQLAAHAGITLLAAASFGCHHSTHDRTGPAASPPRGRLPGEIVNRVRIREECPIRLGMVALYVDAAHASASPEQRLSPALEAWVANHCDVAAFDANSIDKQLFTRIRAAQPLFTGLLYTYASSIYEQSGRRGSVGVWKPEMEKWALRTKNGAPVKHPDSGGHWMDCASPGWQSYWFQHAGDLARAYHADGVIAADMPPGNTFVGDDLAGYSTFVDKVNATDSFLQAVHRPSEFLVVPSSVGFDRLVGRPTLPLDIKHTEPMLKGRCWDEFTNLCDGAWAEGWVGLYWSNHPLSESDWEVQLEAVDRIGRFGDICIAALAYSNRDELEYGLASYLLIAHHQGRVVIQPMPILNGQPTDAGLSLAVMMREYQKYQAYFDVDLGASPQDRQLINVAQGAVWRRKYIKGDVYVNPSDTQNAKVLLGGPMITVDGKSVTTIALGPHSGIILRYPPGTAATGRGPQSTGAK